jgi:hypothetical protein
MKKVMTMALLAILILGACEKEETQTVTRQQSPNRVIVVPDGGKTGNSTILLAISIGHPAEGCNGCVWEDGKLYHVNCMGDGNYCASSAAVQLQQAGYTINAVTTDTFDLTSEDFFLMPDRSLDYTDDKNNHYYLNIPGQMVYRDSTTLQFTFTGLFFSNSPAYEND